MRMRTRLLPIAPLAPLALIAALASPHAAAALDARDEAKGYLGKVGFTSTDIAALEAGQVISRSETAKDTGEMVAIAAVKIRAPRDKVVDYYGEMVKYVDGKVTLGFGVFSTPPVRADVGRFGFDRNEIEEMKSCQPGELQHPPRRRGARDAALGGRLECARLCRQGERIRTRFSGAVRRGLPTARR